MVSYCRWKIIITTSKHSHSRQNIPLHNHSMHIKPTEPLSPSANDSTAAVVVWFVARWRLRCMNSVPAWCSAAGEAGVCALERGRWCKIWLIVLIYLCIYGRMPSLHKCMFYYASHNHYDPHSRQHASASFTTLRTHSLTFIRVPQLSGCRSRASLSDAARTGGRSPILERTRSMNSPSSSFSTWCCEFA